jgi:class 3 adenylate cyclase
MSETRKIAAILVSDVVGYSRLAGADEDRMLARLRMLRARCARTSLDRRAKCRYAKQVGGAELATTVSATG